MTSTRNISNGVNLPLGIFVTRNEEVYVSSNATQPEITKWTVNATTGVFIMPVI